MIEEYSFGKIKIDGKEYNHDVIIFSDHVQGEWWRKEGHELCLDDMKTILDKDFDVFIMGNGHDGVLKVLPEVHDKMKELGKEFIVGKTGDVIKKCNTLSKEKKVICGLHLTC